MDSGEDIDDTEVAREDLRGIVNPGDELGIVAHLSVDCAVLTLDT